MSTVVASGAGSLFTLASRKRPRIFQSDRFTDRYDCGQLLGWECVRSPQCMTGHRIFSLKNEASLVRKPTKRGSRTVIADLMMGTEEASGPSSVARKVVGVFDGRPRRKRANSCPSDFCPA